jgi:peptidoglycan/xylan/chitin deacetylase (PgdA/CDA1 family)
MDFYAWNIDPKDSGGSKSTTEVLVAKFNSQLGSMKHPVILMHDAANKDTSVQALAVMIDQLRAKGYSFDVITRP